MKYLMGVDEGTTGCKAILFTDEGTQIASTARSIRHIIQIRAG